VFVVIVVLISEEAPHTSHWSGGYKHCLHGALSHKSAAYNPHRMITRRTDNYTQYHRV
ncbi:hypothetical protein GBAR_LOCUS28280, partial [Geodia barretti]